MLLEGGAQAAHPARLCDPGITELGAVFRRGRVRFRPGRKNSRTPTVLLLSWFKGGFELNPSWEMLRVYSILQPQTSGIP